MVRWFDGEHRRIANSNTYYENCLVLIQLEYPEIFHMTRKTKIPDLSASVHWHENLHFS